MLTLRRPHITSGLVPRTVELVGLVLVVGFYFVAEAVAGDSSHQFSNLAGPLMLSAILGHGAWRMIRSNPRHLWTALFWFRLSTIVFFGIGTYFVFVIDTEGRQYVESFFWFFDRDVFKMNIVIAVAVLLTLCSARIAIVFALHRWPLPSTTTTAEADGQQSLFWMAIAFLAVGLTIEYTIQIPYDFGWVNFEVPGSLMSLARLKLVGVFLITVWGLRNARWLLPAVTAFLLFDLVAQTLLFAKGNVLISLLMFLLAFLWERASVKRLAVCGALVIALFVALQPLVTDGRYQLEQRYGDQPQAGFSERAEIVGAYFSDERLPESTKQGSSALTRLIYVNAATLVITRYDAGQPGDWPTLLPAVFVPRIFWPEKPIITDVGRDIYELGTGGRTSQAGAGVFADAYWAMGWRGVALFMPIYGLILGVLTAFTARVIAQGRWLYFPVVLMALRIGSRTDGHYLSDVAGGTVILIATLLAFWSVGMVLRWFAATAPTQQRAVMR